MKSPLTEKIGYGLGDMSSSMFWKIFSYYLPIFYTNIFGLKPQHAAFLLLITKLYDAISDPLMGIICDRTETRWGKYRPYLLWMAVPFGLIGFMSFYTPEASYTFKHIYAYVAYILMMTVYTAVNVPYGAMLGVVTADSREKSVFSSFRMFFAYIGSFIAMGIFRIFEQKVGGDMGAASPALWSEAVGIISVSCTILFILCFLLTREHVKVEKPANETKSSTIGKDLMALVTNGPWWLLLGGGVFLLLFGSIRGGAAAYYFANIMGTGMFVTCSIFLIIGEISQMAGVALAVPISEAIGKKATFIAMLVAMAAMSSAIAFLPSTVAGMVTLVVLQVLICVCIGVVSPLLWSMFADVADYSELKHGASSTGLIFSSSSMAQKFGGALGGFLLMWVLAWAGYNAELSEQVSGTLFAIKSLMSWIPAIWAIIGAVCLFFYPLTTDRMKDIQTELAEKRK